MPELNHFDVRLTDAVRSFADRADTRVDAAAVAARASRRRHPGRLAFLGRTVPVPVSLVLLVGLLLTMLGWSIQAGAPWGQRGSQLAPSVTTAPSPSASPSPAPTGAQPVDRYVTGTATLTVTAVPAGSVSGGATHEVGGVASVQATMDDPRVTGTGTLAFSRDVYANVAAEWGTLRLDNATGSWAGTCRGQSLASGTSVTLACWLAGGGAYEGLTYFVRLAWAGPGTGRVDGVVYPGSAPQ